MLDDSDPKICFVRFGNSLVSIRFGCFVGVLLLRRVESSSIDTHDISPIKFIGPASFHSSASPRFTSNLILTKELPKRTKQILGSESSSMYQYNHSRDGVDENLLIFFHGAGDSHLPYDTLGKKMELPQTATLSLSAALSLNNLSNESPTTARKNSSKFVELPFGLGYTWFEEMDYSTGETLSKDHSRRVKSNVNNKQKQAMYLPTECNHDGNGIIVVSIIWL